MHEFNFHFIGGELKIIIKERNAKYEITESEANCFVLYSYDLCDDMEEVYDEVGHEADEEEIEKGDDYELVFEAGLFVGLGEHAEDQI